MYRISLVDDIATEQMKQLEEPFFERTDKKDAHGLLVRSSIVEEDWIGSELLAISRAGVGVNTIQVQKATENGTIVMNTPGVNANAVKELVLSCLFLSVRPVIKASEMVQALEGADLLEQAEANRKPFVGQELQGKVIGLLGLGSIGREVARICYELGMEVLGYARRNHELDYVEQLPLPDILRLSDFVVIMLPSTPETNGLLGKEELSLMKEEAILINVGRSGIVDNAALLQVIEDGKLAKYITDFPAQEFLGNEKIMMLPHIGGSTKEALADSSREAVRALRNYLLFGTVRSSVNFPAVRMVFRAPYRFTIFYQKRQGILSEVFKILEENDLPIGNMTRDQKEDYVYTLIDIESTDVKNLLEANRQLETIADVKRVRLLVRPQV